MFYLTTHSTHFIYGYMASVLQTKKQGTRLICLEVPIGQILKLTHIY